MDISDRTQAMDMSPRPRFDNRVDELDESSPTIAQPTRARVALKQHQLTLLARCLLLERDSLKLSDVPGLRRSQTTWHPDDYIRTRIGIIGDKAGSGKSYVILSLILENDVCQSDRIVRSYGCNRVLLSTNDVRRLVKTTVLVIPHNMCAQWDAYAKAFLPEDCRRHMANSVKTTYALHEIDFDELALLIVTCTSYNRVAEIISSKGVKVKRLVFDEVDNCNLPSCSSIDASFTWFVTASYGNLLYPKGCSGWDHLANKYVWHAAGLKNSGFIKNIFLDLHCHVAMDMTKVLVAKNSDAHVARSIQLPPMLTHVVLCRTPTTIQLLHGVVDNAIIESLNAGDVASALSHVSSTNKSTEENIVSAILDKFQRQVHSMDARIEFASSAPADVFDDDADRESEIARLRKKKVDIAQRMTDIRERISQSSICCICYDDIQHKTITQCCSNSFCFRCINLWLARKDACPLCKATLTSSALMVVQPRPDVTRGHNGQDVAVACASMTSRPATSASNDKIGNLEIIVRNRRASSEACKLLIFASFENSFSAVERVLDRLDVSYAFLKGNHDVVRNVVNRYKNGALDALLVNTRNYGSGLNLENTTDLVMFHKFDNEIEKQVIGRANRMGRTSPLNVWYLLHDNELPSPQQPL